MALLLSINASDHVLKQMKLDGHGILIQNFSLTNIPQGSAVLIEVRDHTDLEMINRYAQQPLPIIAITTEFANQAVLRGARSAFRGYSFSTHEVNFDNGHKPRLLEIISAIENHDLPTAQHLERLSSLSDQVARALELDDSQFMTVTCAARLHDIGKLLIPIQIINKPAKLSDDERVIMNQHPVHGEAIARAVGLNSFGIAQAIRHHHERWDGTGYPDRLSQHEIPIASRIIAVTDAYDAMTSNRPYKSALSHDNALQEIQRCRETQFDPTVVSAFLQLMGWYGSNQESEVHEQVPMEAV